MIVTDTEPLPPQLNPEVIPPEQVLPPELLQRWNAKQQRGLAIVNELKRKIAAERIEKAVKAIITYRAWTGEEPDAVWLAKTIGVTTRHAKRIMAECDKLLAPESRAVRKKERKRREERVGRTLWERPAYEVIAERTEEMCDRYGHTFALMEGIPSPLLFISNVCPYLSHPHLAAAVAAFLLEGYPVPYRALARRFKVHPQQVKRIAEKQRRFMEANKIEPKPLEERVKETYEALRKPTTPPETPPPCPECGTELEPEPSGRAVCVGCGREWQWHEDRWVRVANTETDKSSGFV